MQNRKAAATSREKKKRYHAELETKVDELVQTTQSLQAQLDALMAENARLRAQKNQPAVAVKQEPNVEQELKGSSFLDTTLSHSVTVESAVGRDSGFSVVPSAVPPPVHAPPLGGASHSSNGDLWTWQQDESLPDFDGLSVHKPFDKFEFDEEFDKVRAADDFPNLFSNDETKIKPEPMDECLPNDSFWNPFESSAEPVSKGTNFSDAVLVA